MNLLIASLILGITMYAQAQTPPTPPPPAAPTAAQQARMSDLNHDFREANITLQLDYQKLQGLAEFQDYLATQKKINDIQIEAQKLANEAQAQTKRPAAESKK